MKEIDLPKVLEIENYSFPNPWRASTFKGEIENELLSHPFVIIYEPLDKIIGYVVYWLIHGEVQISNIAVAPEYRHMGVAETVMRRVLDGVHKDGARYVLLEVRPSNTAARSLYNKLGFRVVGMRRNYYHNPCEDAIIMGKVLINNSL